MQHKQLLKQLESFGLTELQAKIYLSILQKNSSVLDISRDTLISRPTIYDNIKVLRKLGLVDKVAIDAKTVFIASNPENLYLALKEKQKAVKDVLPDLLEMYNEENINRPSIKFFNGEEGFERLTNMVLTAHEKTLRAMADYEANINKPFSKKFLRKFWDARVRKHIDSRILYTHNSKEALMQDEDFSDIGAIRYNRQVRILPQDIQQTVLQSVIDNKVLFWTTKEENFSFLCMSDEYAKSLKSLFDYLWEQSESLY